MRKSTAFTRTRLGCVDGERTVWDLGGRELSDYDGVDNSRNNAVSGHVKDKQLIRNPHTTKMYTPYLSIDAFQRPSDPGTFPAESCLLFVVSAQTRS